MKVWIVAIAVGLSLAVSAGRANLLTVVEQDENIIVTFNGAPLSGVDIMGHVDDWTILFPSGWSFAPNFPDFEIPDEPGTINFIDTGIDMNRAAMFWESDEKGTISNPGNFAHNAGTSPFGAFDLIVQDVHGVPDSSTTAMLLGIALGGLGLLRRFVRR